MGSQDANQLHQQSLPSHITIYCWKMKKQLRLSVLLKDTCLMTRIQTHTPMTRSPELGFSVLDRSATTCHTNKAMDKRGNFLLFWASAHFHEQWRLPPPNAFTKVFFGQDFPDVIALVTFIMKWKNSCPQNFMFHVSRKHKARLEVNFLTLL